MGSQTSFTRKFNKKRHRYSEIDIDDVEREFERLGKLGEPFRDSDIKAKEETLKLLRFLEKWTEEDTEDVRIIMKDEFP
jgi:hypothetical protein